MLVSRLLLPTTKMNRANFILTPQIKPLLEFLRKQRENERLMQAVENIATIFLIIFFLLVAVRPTVMTISALLGEIKSKEILKAKMRQKINDVVQAQDSFSQVQERYYIVDSALPDRPSYGRIVGQFQSLATSSGFSLRSVDIRLKGADTQPESYGTQLNSNIPFASVFVFLENLGRIRRLITIDNINLSQSSSDSQSDQPAMINFGLTSKVYFWRQ